MKKKIILPIMVSLCLTIGACAMPDPPMSLDNPPAGSTNTSSKPSSNPSSSGKKADTPSVSYDSLIASTTARDNTPVCPVPDAPGTQTAGNDLAVIDYSHVSDGYIMVNYLGSNGKVKLQITGPNKVTYTYNIQNGYAAFPITSGDGSYEISVCENIEGTKYAVAYKTSLSFSGISEFGPYLHPKQYVNYNSGNKVVTLAANLAATCNDDLEVVTAVYNYIIGHITYDYNKADTVKSGYISNVDEILKSNTGICLDYSSVMTSMLRSQSIPTRLEVGYAGEVYHAWISVYIKEVGWLNGIIQFNGKEWSLVDPTFGASTDEKKLKSYIGDGSNYATKYIY
jgi:hypothetical protein